MKCKDCKYWKEGKCQRPPDYMGALRHLTKIFEFETDAEFDCCYGEGKDEELR